MITDGPKTRLQLIPKFRKGGRYGAEDSGKARSSVRHSYSANEKRPKILSFAEAFQSRRRSPWWARKVVSVAPT